MHALEGLLELLRITQQHDVARTAAHGHHVGQGHLPGLVDEERVDDPGHLFARPQPGGSANDVDRICRQGVKDPAVVVDAFDVRLLAAVIAFDFLHAANHDA